MRFEHFALNVPQPNEHAQWYVKHCGMTVARQVKTPPFIHFLADSSGRVIVELYSNPEGNTIDMSAQHPLAFHVALVAEDAEAEKLRLIAAGATFFEEVRPTESSLLIMLRDPWGVPLQLCQRNPPFP